MRTKDYKSLKDKTLTEETPAGDIFFRYNHDNEGFEFWCDKHPSYKILDTVARKYVKKFSCVDLYIDKREETWKQYWVQKKLEKEREERRRKKQKNPQKKKLMTFLQIFNPIILVTEVLRAKKVVL